MTPNQQGYDLLIERFVTWAQAEADIRAAVIIGSRARVDHPADEWLDLDMLVFANNSDHYVNSAGWVEQIGKVWLTFVERTPGGGWDLLVAWTVIAARSAPPAPTRPPELTWERTLGPLLNDRCASCHGQVAGLSYATYESALRGSMHGPVIVPGEAETSKLVVKQSKGNHPGQLSEARLALVKEWINWGAPEK